MQVEHSTTVTVTLANGATNADTTLAVECDAVSVQLRWLTGTDITAVTYQVSLDRGQTWGAARTVPSTALPLSTSNPCVDIALADELVSALRVTATASGAGTASLLVRGMR